MALRRSTEIPPAGKCMGYLPHGLGRQVSPACCFPGFFSSGVHKGLGNVLGGDYDKMCIKNVTCFAIQLQEECDSFLPLSV